MTGRSIDEIEEQKKIEVIPRNRIRYCSSSRDEANSDRKEERKVDLRQNLRAKVYIEKWVDYTKKYGFGY